MFSRLHILNLTAAIVFTGIAAAQTPGTMNAPMASPQNPNSAAPQANPASNPNIPPQDQMDPYGGDKDFVKSAVEISATEVHLGKLAEEKASSDSVKELGKRMVDANSQMGEQLKKAAAAMKVQVSDDPPRKAKKAEDKLAKLSGTEFDRAYAKMVADEQKQAVKQYEREAKDGKAPGLKDFAAKSLSGEQERQKQAEELAGTDTARRK